MSEPWILVIDVGTSSVRAAPFTRAGVGRERSLEFLADSPADGLVEFDAAALIQRITTVVERVVADQAGQPDASGVAIANQRCTTIVWDADTRQPVAPALGWQDLRTIGLCLELGAEGFRFAPNQTATKAAHLWDTVDPDRQRALRVGTIDTWVAAALSEGAAFVTEPTNAAIGGLLGGDAGRYDANVVERLRLPAQALAEVRPSLSHFGDATALAGAPPIVAMLGDQQASMLGQGATVPGAAKMTFGTGGMFDMCTGTDRPAPNRSEHGGFPIVCWSDAQSVNWGVEGIMLAAGTAVEWLVSDLGIIDNPGDSDALAASVPDTGGVMFVPSFLGEGTPRWDFGARGALLGLTRGTTKAHICRAVLDGVARAAADVVAACETDSSLRVDRLRVDGGMSRNRTFVQLLANALQRPVDVSVHTGATAYGAGLAAATYLGWDVDFREQGDRSVVEVFEPDGGPGDVERWRLATERSAAWYPELSALDF